MVLPLSTKRALHCRHMRYNKAGITMQNNTYSWCARDPLDYFQLHISG